MLLFIYPGFLPVQPMSIFLAALGLMMVFEGIPYFCFPAQVKAFARKIPEIPDTTLRIVGLFLMLLGLAVAYFGRFITDNA
ncbi:MAG: DUF2065 domain-containing protein [Nitrospinae bacterium]|nr:DUF2065 domain-containing protein [Nitrospinota bacterium]MDA1108758.1 DUF2065 domain-containing protein [Nitrospinota bacterium]